MTHADIIARLEAATGPDKELAVDIYQELDICSYIPDEGDPTASLDACLALIERVLPGWAFALLRKAIRQCVVHGLGISELPRLALLALFHALEAQEAV